MRRSGLGRPLISSCYVYVSVILAPLSFAGIGRMLGRLLIVIRSRYRHGVKLPAVSPKNLAKEPMCELPVMVIFDFIVWSCTYLAAVSCEPVVLTRLRSEGWSFIRSGCGAGGASCLR